MQLKREQSSDDLVKVENKSETTLQRLLPLQNKDHNNFTFHPYQRNPVNPDIIPVLVPFYFKPDMIFPPPVNGAPSELRYFALPKMGPPSSSNSYDSSNK